jgi:hypothetical protein
MGIDVEKILAENNLREECPYLSSVRNVYFTGSVKGTGKYTGGIVGYNIGLISESYALGSVEGGEYAGGIAGYTKSELFDYNDDGGRLELPVENSLAANSLIKGKNTARIAAFIDGEQKTIPNNFAISASNKSFTRFSEGDYYTGVSKNGKELKNETIYSTTPPEGLGWQFQNDVNQNTEDYPWTMEGSTTGYPIFYWQVKKPECYYCKFNTLLTD